MRLLQVQDDGHGVQVSPQLGCQQAQRASLELLISQGVQYEGAGAQHTFRGSTKAALCKSGGPQAPPLWVVLPEGRGDEHLPLICERHSAPCSSDQNLLACSHNSQPAGAAKCCSNLILLLHRWRILPCSASVMPPPSCSSLTTWPASPPWAFEGRLWPLCRSLHTSR